MKTFRMFSEDYVDAYSIHRTSTGPGMGQYVPTADLNASKKKKNKKLKEAPLKMKHGDAIDVVLDKVKDEKEPMNISSVGENIFYHCVHFLKGRGWTEESIVSATPLFLP